MFDGTGDNDEIKRLRRDTFNSDYIDSIYNSGVTKDSNGNVIGRYKTAINEHYIGNDNVSNRTTYYNNSDTDSSMSEGKYNNGSYSYFTKDMGLDDSVATNILNSSNIYTVDQIYNNRFNKFSRYGLLDMTNSHTTSREYLFFSKPDLNLVNTANPLILSDPLSGIPFFQNALKQFPSCMFSLQQTYDSYKIGGTVPFNFRNKFIPMLSNQVSSTLDLDGITASETQNNTNLYQITTTYRDGSEVSDCGSSFTLEFNDTRYLDVYMLFKIYDEYFREKYKRDIIPVKISYIDDKIIPECMSIWKIIVDETNTIIYYAKATGVTPMSVPRDAMSNFEGGIKETISFKAQFVKDLDPISLIELNHLSAISLGLTNKTLANKAMLTLKDSKLTIGANTEWGSVPYIGKVGKRHGATNADGELYKLMWVK